MLWGEQKQHFSFRVSPIQQSKDERLWKEVSFKKVNSFGGIRDSLLFMPQRMYFEKNGYLSVLDGVDGFIKQFDSDGNYLMQFGKGKGSGPGELSFPFDFTKDKNGNYCIIDLDEKKIVCLNPEEDIVLEEYFKYDTPGRIFPAHEKGVYVTTTPEKEKLVNIIDVNGTKTPYLNVPIHGKHNDLPERVFPYGMPYLGEYIDTEFGVIYVPTFISQIIFYDREGAIKKSIKTIDNKLDILELHFNNKQNGIYIQEPFTSNRINLAAFITNNKLGVWSKAGEQITSHAVDFYDTLSGEYEFSIDVSQVGAISQIIIKENKIYTSNFSTGVINIWEYSYKE